MSDNKLLNKLILEDFECFNKILPVEKLHTTDYRFNFRTVSSSSSIQKRKLIYKAIH